MGNLTLKWKIFVMLLGFCAMLLVILWLFQTVFLNAFYIHIRVSEIKRNVGMLESNIGRENMAELVEGVSEAGDLVVEIIDLHANGAFAAFFPQDRRIAADSAALIALARDNDGEHYEYYSPPRNPLNLQSQQNPQGTPGPQWPQGQQYPPGPFSPQWPQGSPSPQWPQGQQDPQGTPGPQGPQGQQDMPGLFSPQWPQGQQDMPGPFGPQGAQSAQGGMRVPPPPSAWNRQYAAQSIAYVKIVGNPSGTQQAIIIRAVISPVNATVTTLRYQLYYISGLMLLFSIVLAIAIAKKVSKPIEEITRGAHSLAKGNYGTRFTGTGYSEIIALSNTLNKAAVELGRVEGLRRELLANVSHDLRTPLALIFSYAEMMNDFPEEATAEQTKAIMDEARRLTTLVNDILDISNLESDMEKLNATRFNLTQGISETTARIGALLNNEGFRITFCYDGDIYVNADELKISRAFYNLLINAVNYSGDSREVTVTQAANGNSVRISVEDGGEGIEEADLPFVWERYYRSGAKHKRAVTGTGLGLSIVKKIIELHCGRYGVESKVGKGSVFWFEIEIAEPGA